MITPQLPDEVERRLEELAASSGLPASLHAERAIADIQDSVLLILVLRIGNRKDVDRR